jgi:hypothetical protein
VRKKNINLLQERGAPPTFWERFYIWATNTCRVIVVLTELIVLGAFGWRFWLDRRLNDLKDDIEAKGEILKSLSDQELEIRDLQSKMNTFNQLWDQASNMTAIVGEVNEYIPEDTEELNVTIQDTLEITSISISGKSQRSDVSKIEGYLKDSESFSDVVLSEMEKDKGEGDIYTFTMTAKIVSNNLRESISSNESSES